MLDEAAQSLTDAGEDQLAAKIKNQIEDYCKRQFELWLTSTPLSQKRRNLAFSEIVRPIVA